MPERASLLTASPDSLTSWIIDWISREFKIDHKSIEPGREFLSFGMESVQAMTMVGDLESELNTRLPPTLVWDYPTIAELAVHLAEFAAGATSPAVEAMRQETWSASTASRVEGLAAELDALTDRDVEVLLNP